MRFQDKVVVVTGAAQGIGEAYARALAAEGASVVVADLNAESGEKVAADIGGLFVRTDVSSHESAAALVEATVERYGGIDGLVEIPGVAQTPAGQNRRVVTIEDGLLYSFGSRTAVALAALIDGLY